jgi:Fic family protein
VGDEYVIDGFQFRQALLEQRGMGLRGGIYHQTQVRMAYNTNRIEGSTLSEFQTQLLYDTKAVDGFARYDDVVETANMFRMFNMMLDTVDEPITAEKIKTYHAILKQGTTDADKPWFAVGEWKRLANIAGVRETSPPDMVDGDIAALIAATPTRMTFNDICDFHYEFETIHPFQDGNGRVGRLLMFEQCLKNNQMPFIVLENEKNYYYRGLNQYADEPAFLRETFRHFQDVYYEQFKDFVPLIQTESQPSPLAHSITASPPYDLTNSGSTDYAYEMHGPS